MVGVGIGLISKEVAPFGDVKEYGPGPEIGAIHRAQEHLFWRAMSATA
jgi:hypothetical protein